MAELRLVASEPEPNAAISVRGLTVRAGRRTILRRVDLDVPATGLVALIGPSGVGKSTLLRCLNRLVDLTPGLVVEGRVWFRGQDVFARGVDPDALRARIGTLFQQPVVFPGSVFDNVCFGLRHLDRRRRPPRQEWPMIAERVLREVALWDEVSTRLPEPAHALSIGQQQRLCLARALALEPALLLLDEPTSALDPQSTAAIEELLSRRKRSSPIVLVTHNLEQARRVADRVGCLCLRDGAGEMLETRSSADAFARASCRETASMLEGELPG